MTLEWGDPPGVIPPNRGTIPEWVAMLKERPHKWAKVETFTKKHLANYVCARVRQGAFGQDFEACYRMVGPHEFAVWARYAGPER